MLLKDCTFCLHTWGNFLYAISKLLPGKIKVQAVNEGYLGFSRVAYNIHVNLLRPITNWLFLFLLLILSVSVNCRYGSNTFVVFIIFTFNFIFNPALVLPTSNFFKIFFYTVDSQRRSDTDVSNFVGLIKNWIQTIVISEVSLSLSVSDVFLVSHQDLCLTPK